MSDQVNHPSHYADGKIECIEAIEQQKLGFHVANAFKYIWRAGKKSKSTEVEDLKKAVWYLNRQIALLEGRDIRPNDMNPREQQDAFDLNDRLQNKRTFFVVLDEVRIIDEWRDLPSAIDVVHRYVNNHAVDTPKQTVSVYEAIRRYTGVTV